MPEQDEQSRNEYLALISRLENTDADTAKDVKPDQAWLGAAETGESYAEFDRLYTLKNKIPSTLK